MYSIVYEKYRKVIALSVYLDKLINCIRNESERTYLIHQNNSNTWTYKVSFKKSSVKIVAFFVTTAIVLGSASAIYKINALSKEVEQTSEKLKQSEILNSQLVEDAKNLEKENTKLENQNYNLEKEVNDIVKKASELETKIDELNGVRDKLYETLDQMDSFGQKYKEDIIDTVSQSEPKKYTSLLYTPLEKTSSLSTTLSSIEIAVNTQSSDFTLVADNVTTTLASNKSRFASRILEGVTIPSLMPADGRITSHFAGRTDPLRGGFEYHKGLDISVPIGTPVHATASGTVTISKLSSSYGYYVKIDHGNEYETLYAHNSELLVNVGDYVEAGQVIALSGATGNVTGPHVHYEVLENGVNVNPIDFLP